MTRRRSAPIAFLIVVILVASTIIRCGGDNQVVTPINDPNAYMGGQPITRPVPGSPGSYQVMLQAIAATLSGYSKGSITKKITYQYEVTKTSFANETITDQENYSRVQDVGANCFVIYGAPSQQGFTLVLGEGSVNEQVYDFTLNVQWTGMERQSTDQVAYFVNRNSRYDVLRIAFKSAMPTIDRFRLFQGSQQDAFCVSRGKCRSAIPVVQQQNWVTVKQQVITTYQAFKNSAPVASGQQDPRFSNPNF